MLNPDHRRYFIPESGVTLEKAEAYRQEFARVHAALNTYVQSVGGTHYTLSADGGIRDVRFPGGVIPAGWKATKPRHSSRPNPYKDLYRPRFGSQAAKDVAALPTLPNPMVYLAHTNFLTEVDYRPAPDAPECKAPIGNPNTPLVTIDWYDMAGPMLVVLPDQAITCAALKRQYPEVVFLHDEDKHDPDITGMREILLKEYELMEEKHKRGM